MGAADSSRIQNSQPLAAPKVNETQSSFALGRHCSINQARRITNMLEHTEFETQAPGPPGSDEPAALQGNSGGSSASLDDDHAPGQVTLPLPVSPEIAPSRDGANAVWKIGEWLRRKDGSLGSSQFEFSAPIEATKIFQQMIDRGDYNRDPWERIPLPTGTADYGTTSDLFADIKLAIKGQTHLSDRDCALLTLWIFATWLHVALPLAPGLAITGCAHEADVLLRTLRALCYHPVLLVGVTSATLESIRWSLNPTLLIVEPALSKRMATLLDCSTGRGYLARIKADGGQSYPPPDYFGPKAFYLGEDMPAISELRHYLRINTSIMPRVESQRRAPLSEELKQRLQNQLLAYRLRSMPAVIASEFNVVGLSPEANAIASALGKCVAGAPQLQAEIVSLLTPFSDHQISERLDDFGTLVIGAALTACHQSKNQVLVGEVAAEVNRIQKERGERLVYSPEKVGHRLRKAGLITRRLGAAGNGLLLDLATRTLIHDVAGAYGCVGLSNGDENLHCPLCIENK
jgi:hypothetical protein